MYFFLSFLLKMTLESRVFGKLFRTVVPIYLTEIGHYYITDFSPYNAVPTYLTKPRENR